MTDAGSFTWLARRYVTARRLATRRAPAAARALLRAWRHSLQLRVALTTLVVTSAVVLVSGIFLVDQVTGGILRAKRDAAVKQAAIGEATASSVLSNYSS